MDRDGYEGRGKREEGKGKREEGRGKKGRGKREKGKREDNGKTKQKANDVAFVFSSLFPTPSSLLPLPCLSDPC
jgi:hypothetical protein